MPRYAVLQGPNLNRLGKRDPARYGHHTLADVQADIDECADELGVETAHFQSNHEGALIDWLHEQQDQEGLAGIILNPAGLTRAGWSLRTAVQDACVPIAVVHLSELHRYGPQPEPDIFLPVANVYLAGAGWRGYRFALQALHHKSG
ncbi:type II 3-dehydroquinate dehydratase [Streptomyces boluensis]|uniref:3-dehydroquinate dehydratase n=1 Tax=Streptomyces boluensis TaxID=1775135 RepID=A0A964UK83_9ACTN|nr:type II 3-dehydroquinate dehydratase [Streptomyces boluensis]NBE50561.1 type II 3-dehydroquinate dehydratase [Streptomyces boluensis]